MSTAVPQNLSQLKLEIYQLSQKKPFASRERADHLARQQNRNGNDTRAQSKGVLRRTNRGCASPLKAGLATKGVGWGCVSILGYPH